MVNIFSTSLNASEILAEGDLRKMDISQLKMEMKKAIDGEDDGYFQLVQKIYNEKINEGATSIKNISELSSATDGMKKEYEAIMGMPEKTTKEKNAKKKAMQDFFKNDMKNRISRWEKISSAAQYQQNEAERLKVLLGDATSKKVKLRETLPFGKMGRLKRINMNVQKIKDKYPDAWAKSVLQYLMAQPEVNHTWFTQMRKRVQMKLFWGKNSQHINEQLKVIESKLKPDEKDWVIGILVKDSLKALLEEAKAQYIKEQKESVYWMTA